MDLAGILFVGIGAAAGSIVAYLLMKSAASAQQDRAVAELSKRREVARTQIENAETTKRELDQRLTAALRDREAEVKTLNARLTAAIASDAAQRARFDELESAQRQLQDVFNSLSAEALRNNNEQFLQLARTELEKVRVASEVDLDKKEKAIADLLTPIRDGLQAYDAKLHEIELGRIESEGRIAERLVQVGQASDALRGQTQGLIDALRSPGVRGRWGEVQLKRVCELAGMLENCDFTTQTSVDTEDGKQRPDLVVRLAGGRNIIVDAKAPLAAYLEAMNATDEDCRCACLDRHAASIRAHVRVLSAKAYWDAFAAAPEFVVLFIPGEVFFSAALERDPALLEFAAELNVILATPTSLIALLRTAAAGWRQESVARSAEEIARLARELFDRIRNVGDHFIKIGDGLEKAVRAYNDGVGSIERRLLVTARKLNDQGVFPSEEIAVLSPVEIAPRTIMAAELLPPPARGVGSVT